MAHCGYEATAAEAMFTSPLQAIKVALRGPRTEGEMAPEVSLAHQRPAQYIFSDQVQMRLSEIRAAEALEKARKSAAKAQSATTAA
jgi:hypothetical protein